MKDIYVLTIRSDQSHYVGVEVFLYEIDARKNMMKYLSEAIGSQIPDDILRRSHYSCYQYEFYKRSARVYHGQYECKYDFGITQHSI